MDGYLIERDSAELWTSEHRVYVTGPHFGNSIYSSTLRADDAARWPTESAARMAIQRHTWGAARIVPAEGAPDLPTPHRLAAPRK